MKNTFLSFLLSFILIVIFLGSSVTTFSQTKEVYVELEQKKQEYPIYIEVPDKGVIVFYLTLDKTTQYNIIFFDENLQEKWKITDISIPKKIHRNHYNSQLSFGDELINGKVTPNGKYAYIANIIDDIVYRIDIATGKWEAIPLAEKLNKDNYGYPKGYTINFNIDDNYYYLSEIGEFYMNSDISKRNKLTVNRIKHGENKFESFSFSPTPANGKEKPKWAGRENNTIIQHWELFFIKDNKIFLKDNFPHGDGNEIGYRKMAVYSIEGKILSEANFPMGHRVSQGFKNYSGVISYNSRNKDKIYTFALNKDEPVTILYKCYDLDLKLLWEKSFTLKSNEKFKISDVFVDVFHNYDNSLALFTSIGVFFIDNNGDNPVFKPLCIDENVVTDCNMYEKLNKVKSIVAADIKKHKTNTFNDRSTQLLFFKVKDKVIYAYSQPGIGFYGDFYRLATFDIK